jgi:hypothetical protein
MLTAAALRFYYSQVRTLGRWFSAGQVRTQSLQLLGGCCTEFDRWMYGNNTWDYYYT